MPEPLFNSRLRALHRNLAFLGLLSLGAAPYVAAFLALALVPSLESSPLGTALAGAALVLSAFLPWAGQGRLALIGNARLRRALRARLGAAATGEFVGFSPGAELLSFEGETDQDVGFLDWEGNTLIYRGDRYSWTLRREAIDEISVGGTLQAADSGVRIPGGPQRVVLYWHGPREPGRALTLAAREGDTVAATNRVTLDLARRLQTWWEQEHPDPDEIALLGLPPLDLRGAVPLGRLAPGSCLSVLALSVIVGALLWQTASRLTDTGQYARSILWAGLIVTLAIIATGHVLAYLQIAQGQE